MEQTERIAEPLGKAGESGRRQERTEMTKEMRMQRVKKGFLKHMIKPEKLSRSSVKAVSTVGARQLRCSSLSMH